MTDLPCDSELPCDSQLKVRRPPPCSVQVETGSRLHFGLLDTVDPFGGVGVMIEHPVTRVAVSPSDRFVCADENQARIGEIAQRIAEFANLTELPQCQVEVQSRSPAHRGLGSGTQLALATVEAVCRCLSIRCDSTSIATHMAMRGQRSAVGVHGYFRGGLIFESADQPTAINSLRGRVELPSHWCVALIQPRHPVQGVSGAVEREQFAKLLPADADARSALSRSVRQILKAGKEGRFEAFASAVHQYNYESGKLFRSVQGGPYNGPAVTDLISELIDRGGKGVGQSSWGPGVFVWFESRADAEAYSDSMSKKYQVSITRPRNHPRIVQELPPAA